MSKNLSDVHQIADDLIRMGELPISGADKAAKLIRVARQEAIPMPSTALFALETQFEKLSATVEEIRKSVELTEAHVLLQSKASKKADVDGLASERKGRGWVFILLLTNLLTLFALANEFYEGQLFLALLEHLAMLQAKFDLWLNVKT